VIPKIAGEVRQLPTSAASVNHPLLQAAADVKELRDLALGPRTVAARKAIYGECFTQDSVDPENSAARLKWRWMVDGNWILIVPDSHNRLNDKIELYDLSADPFGDHNAATSHGEGVEKMRRALDKWRSGTTAHNGGRPAAQSTTN